MFKHPREVSNQVNPLEDGFFSRTAPGRPDLEWI